MKYFVTLLLLLVYSSCLYAQVDLSTVKDRQIIGKQISYFKDKTEKLTINDIEQEAIQELFVSSKRDILFLGFDNEIYWVKIQITNPSDSLEYILNIIQPFNRFLDFYYKDTENNWKVASNGTATRWENLNYKNIYPTFSLAGIATERIQTIYIRVQNNAMQLPIYAYEKGYFEQFFFVNNVVFGVFFGFILFVLINNLYLFIFFRQRIYLYYVGVTLGYLLFASGYEGYLKYVFIHHYSIYYTYIEIPTMLAQICYGIIPLYTFRFFDISKKHFFYRIIILYATGAFCVFFTTLIHTFLGNPIPYRYIITANQIVGFLSLVITVWITFYAYRKQLSGATYFLAAYILLLIFTCIEIINISFGVLPYIFRLSYVTVGMLIEVAILALALSKKFEDKQRKLNEAKEAVQAENLRLVSEQKAILEQKVLEKTADLQESNEELQQTNEELQQTHEEMVMLNDTLSSTYNKLKTTTERMESSIRYAERIQQIILPTDEDLLSFFKDYTAIYLPKDIVSGDFYWAHQISDTKILFALADCTGHGVPGAFMTMIGSTSLHEVVGVKKIYSPAIILKELDSAIQNTLKQNRSKNLDGMDIAVCLFEKKDDKSIALTIASAKSKVYFKSSNGELQEFSGNRTYIGGTSRKEKSFDELHLELQKDDIVYLASDGFADQNNMQRNRFGSQNFQILLEEIMYLPLGEQQAKLLQALKNHQAEQEQRDDISLVALQV